ncbi:hypothetical protein HK104_008171 [Borealophlyctis nickersoniae]|nr:hypothetical protein HK104_008171 [Borealophlyctis nickersoniae]
MNSPPALDGAETQLEARNYFERKHINQILESIVTGLTFTKPDDPLAYIEDCVQRIRKGDLLAGKSKLQWDLFIPASSHKDIPRQKTSAAPQRSVPPLRKKVHPQLAPIKQQAAQAPFMMPEISSKPLSKRGGGGNGAGKGDAGSGAAGKIAGEERTDRPNIRSPSKLETASVPSAGVLHLMATPSATELSSHQTEGGRPATETLSGVRPLPPITHHMDVPEETTDVEVSQVERPDTPAAQLTTAEPVPEEAPAVQTAPEFEITPLAFKGPAWDNIVFVLGGPGCGKGTNCVRLAKDFNYTHLSAGDLLRAEVATGSDLGKELENLMKEGKIVPMHVTLRLLREAMEKNDDADGFLIDGFPRQLDQAEAFEKQAISSVAQCKFVLYFECTEELLERRLLERGKTSGRADDNIETIKKRFNTFLETSLPVINRYVELGKCIKISSEPPMEEVYQNVRKYFDKPKPLYHNNVVFMLVMVAGKGTQCERLAKEFHLTHLSTGDLLRAEIEKGSDIGKAAEDLMKEGLMVPSEVILRLLRDSMEANKNTPGFLIDGFPRAMDQAQEFERMIGPCRTVVYFHCSLEVLEQRLLERGKTSGRLDDNLETIKKRFHTFENQSMPVIEHYKKKGKCVQVSSEDTIDGVYNIARQLFIPPTPISHPNIIFMLGKGTQCKKLAEEFQLNHVSTGDLLRAEVANGTAYGRLVERCMQEGQLAGNVSISQCYDREGARVEWKDWRKEE